MRRTHPGALVGLAYALQSGSPNMTAEQAVHNAYQIIQGLHNMDLEVGPMAAFGPRDVMDDGTHLYDPVTLSGLTRALRSGYPKMTAEQAAGNAQQIIQALHLMDLEVGPVAAFGPHDERRSEMAPTLVGDDQAFVMTTFEAGSVAPFGQRDEGGTHTVPDAVGDNPFLADYLDDDDPPSAGQTGGATSSRA